MMIPDRFPAVVAVAAMGVYVVLLAGATTVVTDAAAACQGWPGCGPALAAPSTAIGWIAIAHRVVAFLVGLTVLAAAVMAWDGATSRRVKWVLTGAVVLYPIQSGIGAVVATTATTSAMSRLHLVMGMLIFAGLVTALAWWLEDETGTPSDGAVAAPERDLPPVDEVSEPSLPDGIWNRAQATVAAYYRLMKPRLMWLLCLVASAAMALAGGEGFTATTVAATLSGGALAIGASGTFNHVLERDVDRRMKRTSDRPLATELIPVRRAMLFGVTLAAVSLGLFWSVNVLAAILGAVAIVFYSVIYTLILKPNTVQNTVIGGAAGALPALIGWAAVTGEIGVGGVLLAAVIFLWTPAHFYNLALAYKDDYERGGFPMMPVVRGETTTRRHILWYTGATFLAAAVLAWVTSALGLLYMVVGVSVGGVFLWAIVRLHYEQTETAAFRAFHASNAYLGCLLIAVVLDTIAL
ncbi:MAG: protoheme IX farnesyltransferase [uncultured archaeon A07HR60]|nr:MAG: protoheme IX farnesyltransferase [uncultured archaeon A07HR60]